MNGGVIERRNDGMDRVKKKGKPVREEIQRRNNERSDEIKDRINDRWNNDRE